MTLGNPIPGSPEFNVQFLHPSNFLGIGENALEAERLVAPYYFGLDAGAVSDVRRQFIELNAQRAQHLLGQKPVSDAVAQLPFVSGDVVATVGDSITDDLQSWAYLFEAILKIARPEVNVVNFGKSGDTTVHLIEKFAAVVLSKASWIIYFVGTNDAKAFDFARDRSLVSPPETAANVALLDKAARESSAKVLWILPPLADESVADSSPYWKGMRMTWRNRQLRATRAAISSAVSALDLEPIFSEPTTSQLLLDDGLHPSAAGHELIVKALFDHLSKISPDKG